MSKAAPGAIVTSDVQSGYSLPSGFKISSLRDALGVDVYRGPTGDQVAVTFDTVAGAQLREPEVRAVLRLPATEVQAVSDSVQRRGPLWPTTVYARIERVVAAVGVVLAIVNYWSTFFGSANVAIDAPMTQNVVSGARPEFTLRAINRKTTDADVDLQMSPEMRIEPAGLALESREEAAVKVQGLMPLRQDTTAVLSGRARAGLLWKRQPIRHEIQLVVWPSVAVRNSSDLRVYRDGRAADASFPLRVGDAAPNGVHCEAMILNVPNVTVTGGQPALEMGKPQTNPEKGNELAMLWWVVPTMDAFTERTIHVLLESSVVRSSDEWKAILPSVDCKRRT